MKRLRRAFTLIELMVVVAIIGLLATVVTVSVLNESYKAQVTKVKSDMSSIETAVGLFRLHNGRFPRNLQELWVRPSNAPNWGPDPYINKQPPKDPWGHEYEFQVRGRQVELTSYGADGAPGGADEAVDLTSQALLRES